MSIFKFLQNNFTTGQLSPLLSKRSDFQRYKNGAKTIKNLQVMPQGGLTARTGSLFVAETKDSSKVSHFMDFKFSATDAYEIEVGDLYMRFYKDSGLILESDLTITGISQANPAVVTSTAHGLSNGDQVYITEVVGMTEINNVTLYYTVANKTANTFEVQDRDGTNVDSSAFTAYSSGGVVNKIFEIATPYVEADVPDLQWTQSGDVISITHLGGTYQNRDLTRIGDTNWTLVTVALKDGPYLAINSEDTTIVPSAKEGTITWTASAVTGINNGDGFKSTDVGRTFRWFDRGPSKTITGITQANPGVITSTAHGYSNGDLVYITDVVGMTEINDRVKTYIVQGVAANTFTLQDKDEVNVDTSGFTSYTSGGFAQKSGENIGTWHSILITAFTSTTVVDGTIDSATGPLSSLVPQLDWRLGTFSDTTGWPEAITYYQQRLILTQGENVHGSATDDFTNFSPGDADDADAIEYTVATGEVNNIKWVSGGSRRLRIGTEGGISSLWGGSANTAITPTNAVANVENTTKCKGVKPLGLGNRTLFVQRSGKVVRELVYSFDTDGLQDLDITVLSEDVLGDKGDTTDAGVTRMAYQQEPTPLAWCVKDNGEMASLTYVRDQEVVAWSNNVFGGSNVAVESVSTIPMGGQDRVWVIVKRTINGVTRRYVEKLDTQYRNRSINTCVFSDSHLQFMGDKPAATLTPGATTGGAVTFTSGSAVFVAADVGRFIESNGAKARIDTFTDTSNVVCEILIDFASTAAIAANSWNLSVNSISGLDHLEGESVKVLANGGEIPEQTVSGGSITLDGQYNFIGIGLGYDKELETLDIDFGSTLGTAYGSRGKVIDIFFDFFETMGGSIGYDEDNLTEIIFREGTDDMGQGVGPLTGFQKLRVKGGWRDSIKTLYRNSSPLPVTILAMVIKGSINE